MVGKHRRGGSLGPVRRKKTSVEITSVDGSTQTPLTDGGRSYDAAPQAQALPQDTSPRKKSYAQKYVSNRGRKGKSASKQSSSFAPSLAPSTVSIPSYESLPSMHDFDTASAITASPYRHSSTNTATTTTAASTSSSRPGLKHAVSSIIDPQNRFATASSLSWGHRPHPVLGASCLLFALPIPFLSTCYPTTAALFGIVTISSFLSDHVYTGLDSLAHTFDKVTAVLTFTAAFRTVYTTGGILWASSSSLAVLCHVLAHSAAKRDEYERFVIWHTMWHVVGVAFLLACFWVNDTMTECMVRVEEGDKMVGLWGI